jgi:L-erythro-3,5-diaminohexanoate dehydrogenase
MSSPIGLHRVLEPKGVLPQAAQRLDASPALADDEVLVRVERLNLDASSFRQLWQQCDVDGRAVR